MGTKRDFVLVQLYSAGALSKPVVWALPPIPWGQPPGLREGKGWSWLLRDKPDILNCISSQGTGGLKWSWAGQKDQGRKTPVLEDSVWLQDGTTPRALHSSATIFSSGLKL